MTEVIPKINKSKDTGRKWFYILYVHRVYKQPDHSDALCSGGAPKRWNIGEGQRICKTDISKLFSMHLCLLVIFVSFYFWLLTQMLMHVCSYLSFLLQEDLVFIQNILIHSPAKKQTQEIKCFKCSNSCVVYVRSIIPSPARSLKPLWAEVLIMQVLSHLLEVLHVRSADTQTCKHLVDH